MENKRIKKQTLALSKKDEYNTVIHLTEFNIYMNEIQTDPISFNEVIYCSDLELWIKAMKDEIDQLNNHNTQEITYPKDDSNIIGIKFVYKIKRYTDNSIDKYKAQLVVQGNY